MSKNRSTWASLLSVVLAMVLMAGLAVTAFAETEVNLTPSGTVVTDRQNLVDVLNGDAEPTVGVNYDVDGNGIVEMADLDAFDGTQEDLLPNGGKDAFSECNPESVSAKTSSAIVRGDSTMSIALDSSVDGYAWIEWVWYDEETGEAIPSSMLDVSGWKELTFDTLWTNGAGALNITIYNDLWETYSITVEATEAGWTTNVIDLLDIPEEFKTIVAMEFTWDGEHEVYIDNLQTAIKLQYVNAAFSSSYDNAGDPIEVIPGAPYGELPELVHTFYTFEGWYLDQGYTQKVTADTIVEADADHTLYAKWSWIAGEEGRVTVASAGNNSYSLTLDGAGYKQIRFRFNVKSVTGNFSMDYADGDSTVTNNPIVTIVDENDNIVHPSKVVAGQWYTAVIYGGTVVTDAGTVTAGGICSTGTLTFAADAKVQIEHLEALSGQFGLQATTRNKETWSMADLTSYGYSYGYHYVQNASNKWDTRIAVSIPSGRYTKMSYDFLITNLQSGKENPWYETSLPLTIRERDTGAEVGGSGTALTPGVWYTAEITLNKTGSDYLYFYGQQYNGADNAARPTFDMYIANVYYEGDGEMIDNVGAGNALTLNKVGADGTFFTSPVSRDRDYGTLYVVEDSASWTDRVLKITLKDDSKELIQVDFRFLVSKNSRGKDVAPTLKASTTISGSLSEAQYIILDENDVPVTSLEADKWYRMFITANGNSAFGLVPATTGEVKLQVKDLIAFNADELATTMTSGNTAAGNLSAVLSRFGKMEYAYAGTAENTVNIRLNSDLYKQVRFSFQLKDRSTILSVNGANLTITDSGDAVVNALNLQVGQWYTATITNSGNTLSKDLALKVAGRTSLVIKDLAAYQSLEIPAENAPSTIFNGLDADEMMIAGFIGPYDEDYYEQYNYDQKIGPLPSLAQDDIFKLLADAGINYITDSHLSYAGAEQESAQRLLRLAAKYGINYLLQTPDIFSIGVSTGTQTVNGNTQHIYAPNVVTTYPSNKAMLDELTQYASFGGSFLRDEPGSDLFEAIRDARAAVKQYNAANGTALNVFANLLPGVGSFRWTNGKTPPGGYTISTWQDYVECFEGVTDFDYLMFDMYPFAGGEGVIEGVFIEYASRLATIAKNTGKMWMGCVQVGGGDVAYSGKRVCNENEMNWDVNVLLAMGAKGLNYYTLVSAPYLGGTVESTDPGYTDHSLLTTRGEKTNYYDWAAKINKQVKAVDHVLMNAEQIGLIFVGDQLTYTGGTGNNNSPYKYESIADSKHLPLITKDGTYGKKYSDVKLSNVTGDHVMIGAFNYDGKTALYVVNNDIVADATGDTGIDNIQLTFNGSYSYEIIQDGLTTWQTGAIANLTLELGHGALIVVHEGAVSMDATVIYDVNYETSVPAPAPVILPLGSVYPELPVLARDFYTFEGWYLDAEGTGNPVKAGDALAVNGSHVLYAKWTYKEDDSLLQPSYTTENSFTNVSRQYVDGVETIVYTTSGKSAPNEGDYQRRFQFNIGDTTKEIVKFRFKYVTSSDASGETVKPLMNYYAGGLVDINSRGFVIVDENGEPAIDSMEVGKWYTFYGLTSAKSYVAVYPAVYGAGYLDITIHIQDRELLDFDPDVNIRDEVHAWYSSTAPYQDNEGNWLFHHRSFTGEHHANSGWNRRSYMDVKEGYSLASFEFKYNVATYIASGAEAVDKVGFGYLTGGVYFDMDGNPVAAADLKVGTWYKAICTAPLANGWFISMGDVNGGSGNTVNIDMDYRNVVGLAADTNPITIASRDKNNLVTTYLGDGMYNINTITASSPGTAAWQWAALVTAPDNTHTNMAVTFRFNAAYAADGVTPIDPSMSIWRGSNASSGVTAQIIDAETGAMVSNDNGLFKALEIGKWYTVVITNPSGDLQTSYRLTPCYKYSGAAKFSIDIADRSVYTAGAITVTTPDSYPNPYTVYSKADGWHQTVFENGSTYNAWQRRTDFGGVAGAQKVEFEVRINSFSGACTAQFGTTETRREFYDLETNEYLGYDNNVTLEVGKWYKVVAYNGDQGALMGDSFRCYPGNASTEGNVSFSVRNIVATYPQIESVSFDLNYTGAVNDLEPLDVVVGGTYGELPAPTRTGYTFAGWYTNAACSGSAVTAQSTVTGAATLYAKWTIGEDTNLLQPSYTTETGFTNVSRDFIDGKDTIIFTTEGKTLINTGWQRRLEFTGNDASKEVVKFTFKFVSNNNADGEAVAPKINFFVGGLDTSNTGAYVVTDGNGNVVNELTTGVWYTFYGMTRGNTRLVLYPCNTAEQLRTTLYIQDRELLDYEPDIHIRDEAHAYYGNTAAYEDADGNWMYHFRSFSGDEHHANSGWNRRTYLDVTGDYNYVAFEFKYNVATYIASGEEAVDKVGFAYMAGVSYFDQEGNPVAAADLKVGTWYTATFPLPLANDWFITMADVGGGGDTGNVVNIDMDYRNFVGYAFDFDYSLTDSYYVTHADAVISGMQAKKITVAHRGDTTAISNRNIVLNLTNTADQIVSMKMKVTECSGTPSIQITKTSGDRVALVVFDEAGNLADSNNLEKNKWYTVRWLANGQEKNQFRFFEGSKTTGVVYIADLTISQAENPFTTAQGAASGFYTQVLPYEVDGETHYMGYVRPTGDGTGSGDRRIVLTTTSAEKQIISMQVKFTACSATPSIAIQRDDYPSVAVDYILTDAEGNVYDGTNLELDKWYTLMWMSQGNLKYRINPITGSAANGTFIMKDINVETVSEPIAPGYYVWVAPFAAGDETHYWVRARVTGDGTEIGNRYVTLKVASVEGDLISMKMMMTATTGTPDLMIKNAGGTVMTHMITDDADGSTVSATEMELGKWYTVSWVADGSATYNIYSFAGTKANGTYFVKDINVENLNARFVSFDLNYAGATGAPATIMVAAGQPYGELPTVTRDGYDFGGWYTDAACSGSAVTAETTVTTSHTLYAKWTMPADTNPVGVVVRDANNLSMSVDYVDGRHIYTTTTRGVSSPGTGAWQWGTGIEVPLGTTHWAVTFRIMEAYQADGETPIERPTMSAWQKNLTSGTTAMIFDAETGEVVSSDNGSYKNTQCLELGKWYTIVSNVPNAENTRHYLFPCQQYSGAAIITMEIAERACHTDDFRNGYVVSTPDSFANPLIAYTPADGWHQVIPDSGAAITAWARRTCVTIPTDGNTRLYYEAKLNSISGDATSAIYVVGSKGQEIYDLETGKLLGTGNSVTLELGKWYGFVTYKSDLSNLGTSYEFCYPGDGSHNAGNCSVSFRNFASYNYSWSVDAGQAAASVTMATDDGEPVWKYTNFGHTITNDPWGRRMMLTIPNNTSDTISMKVKITSVVDGSGADIATRSIVVHPTTSTTLSATFIDENGVAVPNANLELNKWYTMSFVSNGTASYAFWTFAGVAQGEILIKDVTVTPAS